jgi:hypothetical protein
MSYGTGRAGWRLLLAVCLAMVLVTSVALTFVNRGPLPTILAQRAVALLEQSARVRIEVGGVRFAGPFRLVLSNVTAQLEPEIGLTQPVRVEQVQLHFSPLAVLRGKPLGGLERVSLISPRVSLDYQSYLRLVKHKSGTGVSRAAGSEPRRGDGKVTVAAYQWPRMKLVVRNGRFELVSAGGGGPNPVSVNLVINATDRRLQVSQLELHGGAGRFLASGNVDPTGEIALRAEVADWLAVDLLGWYPAISLYGRGTISARLDLRGTLNRPILTGQASLQGADLAAPLWAETGSLPLQQATASFALQSGDWDVKSFEALTATGRLTGRGSVSRGNLNLQISARHLHAPTDVPQVVAWGVTGDVDFDGKVTGTVLDPLLSGQLTLRRGTLWHEAVKEARGLIQLSRRSFQFSQVEVLSGTARYHMQGSVTGLNAPGAGGLDMLLESKGGRAEQLLSVLCLDVEARGKLDGSLVFSGPFGGIDVSGNVKVSEAEVYGETLDRAEGTFRWGDGQLLLSEVSARLGQGSLRLNGTAALDGSSLRLAVEATDWPLDRIEHFTALVPSWQGLVSWSGNLGGSVTNPSFDGRLTARNMRIGKVMLKGVEGPVSLADGDLQTTGLLAATSEGGSWWLAGQVSEILSYPKLNLDLQVENESLSALLSMGGYRIPAVLVDGAVHGTVQISGAASDPEARLRLRLSEREAGVRDVLQLDLHIADRRVKILHAG